MDAPSGHVEIAAHIAPKERQPLLTRERTAQQDLTEYQAGNFQ